MLCPNCGYKLKPSSRTCDSCGAKIDANAIQKDCEESLKRQELFRRNVKKHKTFAILNQVFAIFLLPLIIVSIPCFIIGRITAIRIHDSEFVEEKLLRTNFVFFVISSICLLTVIVFILSIL